MCGRFTIATSEDQLLEAFDASLVASANALPLPHYNISPTDRNLKFITNAPVIRSCEGNRRLEYFTWPFIQQWANGDIGKVVGKYSTINAKIETISNSRSYKHAWGSQQRCLIPLTGFYEWKIMESGGKQPFYITLKNRNIFAMGGIWETSTDRKERGIHSFSIITVEANSLMAEIHNNKKRMPLILDEEQYDDWLSGDMNTANNCICQYPDKYMEAHPVDKSVNIPNNNNQNCIIPVNL